MNRRWWLTLLTVWTLSGVYVGARLTRGWVPHDEGTLAQSAARVQAGQMPHRDYDEIYTGGLPYLDAFAFRVFGENLVSLRIPLFVVFLLWVPAVFYISTRFFAPAGAAIVTLLAVAWSLPNYAAAMPSWYNLFFATFGTAALFRFAETDRRRWLVVAGGCAGLACLVKIIGLYFVAGALLFLAFREQGLSQTLGRRSGRVFGALLSVGLLLLPLLLLALVRRHSGPSAWAAFVAPGAVLAGFLLCNEWSTGHDAFGTRLGRLWRLSAPVFLGFAIPVLVFLVPYLASGAAPDLWRGVFVTPTRRFDFATAELPRLGTALATILLGVLFGVAPRLRPEARRYLGAALVLTLAVMLFKARDLPVYREVWYSMRWLIPVTVVGGVWWLAATRTSELRRQQVLLLLAVAAMCGLVQFPFSSPIYFLYAAPLAALAAAALLASMPSGAGSLGAAVAVFYILFAVRWIHPGFINNMGLHYERDRQDQVLTVERGGLRVSTEDADLYRRLVAEVRAHARSSWVYATPDCPEVPFLAGLHSPTRTLFDFFDDPAGRTDRILAALDRDSVSVVVINLQPGFSGRPPDDLETAMERRYPHSSAVGHFDVRWRE